jgi:hypothetical protein
MPGDGMCATAEHICHTHNCCRGQGGCGYEGQPTEQEYPGAQECRTWGSCATPINQSRITALGGFKGHSTWELARMRFEQKMNAAGIKFGPSPRPGAPDTYVPPYAGGGCGHKEAVEKEIAARTALHHAKNVKGAGCGGPGSCPE